MFLPLPLLLLLTLFRRGEEEEGRPEDRADASSDPVRTRKRMAMEILMVCCNSNSVEDYSGIDLVSG